jgi:hypothetical protein
VGADAFFLAVVDRAQVDDLLEVAPAALDFQELLVAGRDVLGGQLGVGAAEQVLAVQVLLGLDLGGVGAQQPAGGVAQYRFRPGLVEMTPRSSARLVALSLSESLIISPSWVSIRSRTLASRSAASGL